MTNDEKRIAIAKACGWKFARRVVNRHEEWDVYQRGDQIGSIFTGTLPDYLNDLNAMHEAEKILETDKARWEKFAHLVCMSEIVVEDYPTTLFDEWGWYGLLKATAAQRAEAFIATMGLEEVRRSDEAPLQGKP